MPHLPPRILQGYRALGSTPVLSQLARDHSLLREKQFAAQGGSLRQPQNHLLRTPWQIVYQQCDMASQGALLALAIATEGPGNQMNPQERVLLGTGASKRPLA